MTDALPRYEGELRPTFWSSLLLTDATRRALAKEALPDCVRCAGKGFTGGPERGEVCVCVRRMR